MDGVEGVEGRDPAAERRTTTLEAMEAEHAAIDQLITTVNELLADHEADQLRLGDLTDSLVTGLGGHLKH